MIIKRLLCFQKSVLDVYSIKNEPLMEAFANKISIKIELCSIFYVVLNKSEL